MCILFAFLCGMFQTRTITIQVAEAKTEIVEVKDNTEELADYIWLHESGRGKKNYSKCEKIGKKNGIGYGIYGGKWICFDSHEEEMETLKKWITKHKSKEMTDQELLCHYSGNNYEICGA